MQLGWTSTGFKSDCLDWMLMLSCGVATSKALQYLSSTHPDAAVEIALVFHCYVLLFFSS
jgi:hypothetical protein